MQMKVFSLSVLDIMEPIMQSITFKIEVVTIRTKTDKKNHSLFIFFSFSLLTILLQVGCSRAVKVIANGKSIFYYCLPEIHCFHSVESHALLECQEFTPSKPSKILESNYSFFCFSFSNGHFCFLHHCTGLCWAQEPFADLVWNFGKKKENNKSWISIKLYFLLFIFFCYWCRKEPLQIH